MTKEVKALARVILNDAVRCTNERIKEGMQDNPVTINDVRQWVLDGFSDSWAVEELEKAIRTVRPTVKLKKVKVKPLPKLSGRDIKKWYKMFRQINKDCDDEEYRYFSDVEYYAEQIQNITVGERKSISLREALTLARDINRYHIEKGGGK